MTVYCFERSGKIGLVGQRPPLAIDAIDHEASADTGGNRACVDHVDKVGRERGVDEGIPAAGDDHRREPDRSALAELADPQAWRRAAPRTRPARPCETLHLSHRANSSRRQTKSAKPMPRQAACSGTSESGVMPGCVLTS